MGGRAVLVAPRDRIADARPRVRRRRAPLGLAGGLLVDGHELEQAAQEPEGPRPRSHMDEMLHAAAQSGFRTNLAEP